MTGIGKPTRQIANQGNATIRAYLNQGAAPAQQAKAVKSVQQLKLPEELVQKLKSFFGQGAPPVLTRPPAMRYGFIPPAPPPKPPVDQQPGAPVEEPPIAMKYGFIPPPTDQDRPPIAMRYGFIMPDRD